MRRFVSGGGCFVKHSPDYQGGTLMIFEFELPTDQVLRIQLRANISTNTEATACAVFAGAVPSLRTRRFRSTALI